MLLAAVLRALTLGPGLVADNVLFAPLLSPLFFGPFGARFLGQVSALAVRRLLGSLPALAAFGQGALEATILLAEFADLVFKLLQTLQDPAQQRFQPLVFPLALTGFLAKAPKELKTAAIDATLDVAQRLAKKGDKDTAGKIYDKLYAKDQPSRVRRAALQGLAVVRPAESTPLVLEALSSKDATFRGLAINMVKEMPGTEATKAFAGHLAKLPPSGQVALLDALEARKDPAAHDAVVKAVASDAKGVKPAALRALGAVGGAADVAMLAKVAAGEDGAPGNAARTSLSRLRGDDVNKTIVSALAGADAKVKVELIKALAARVASECAPTMEKCAKDSDAGVRRTAIESLGSLGGAKQVAFLVAMLKATTDGGDRSSIDRALGAICGRIREKAADDVVAGMKGAKADAQQVLLNALGRTGGAKALECVTEATKSDDAKVADRAIRVLSGWQDKAAAATLLAIAEESKKKVHKVLAIRGVVNLARLRSTPGKERWEMLSKAMAQAEEDREKKLILGALRDVQTLDALKLVAKYVDDPKLAEEAGAAAARIADRVWNKDKDFTRATMLKVIDNVKNKRTKAEAQKVLARVGPKLK